MVCNTVLQSIAAHHSLWVRPLCCNMLQIIANHSSLWVRSTNITLNSFHRHDMLIPWSNFSKALQLGRTIFLIARQVHDVQVHARKHIYALTLKHTPREVSLTRLSKRVLHTACNCHTWQHTALQAHIHAKKKQPSKEGFADRAVKRGAPHCITIQHTAHSKPPLLPCCPKRPTEETYMYTSKRICM